MLPLVRFFWEMILLRRAPQDLPSSLALLALVLILNVLLGTLSTTVHFGGVGRALLASAMDAGVVAALVYATLRFAGRPARFTQTLTAMYGVAALFGMVMLSIQLLAGALQLTGLVSFATLVLIVWVHLALGHVLRHALETELWAGIAIAVAYTVIGLVFLTSYFPPAELTES